MKNISACCRASGWLVVCLLLALHLHISAQGLTYPKQIDEVYIGFEPSGMTCDARASLHNLMRFRFAIPPKNLSFTIKTQHRRWRQPSCTPSVSLLTPFIFNPF